MPLDQSRTARLRPCGVPNSQRWEQTGRMATMDQLVASGIPDLSDVPLDEAADEAGLSFNSSI